MNPADGVPVLEDLGDVAGKHVLVRCDFNVPVQDGAITDDLRIRAALPTLTYLLERGARVTACSHFGRPKGAPDAKYSLDPVRARLKEHSPDVELLENLRFNPGEEANDPAFVKQLIDGVDLYVNDAFGASHRAHASIVGPPQFVPSAAGRLLAKEVDVLGNLLDKPRRPFVVILGGAKVSDKLGVIEVMAAKADKVLIGGAMAFTFWEAQGVHVNSPLVEPAFADKCRELLASGKLSVAFDFRAAPGGQICDLGPEQLSDMGARDIGPRTAMEFADAVMEAGTVLWNGPMGVFEEPMFEAGTRAVADAMAETKAFTVIGGGDSAAAVAQFKLDKYIDHISTGGGASLELIEQGDLPGLAALRNGVKA
ncbi:MAG: phosphoglycerate kinase [Actinomycetota bacterium]